MLLLTSHIFQILPQSQILQYLAVTMQRINKQHSDWLVILLDCIFAFHCKKCRGIQAQSLKIGSPFFRRGSLSVFCWHKGINRCQVAAVLLNRLRQYCCCSSLVSSQLNQVAALLGYFIKVFALSLVDHPWYFHCYLCRLSLVSMSHLLHHSNRVC